MRSICTPWALELYVLSFLAGGGLRGRDGFALSLRAMGFERGPPRFCGVRGVEQRFNSDLGNTLVRQICVEASSIEVRHSVVLFT